MVWDSLEKVNVALENRRLSIAVERRRQIMSCLPPSDCIRLIFDS